MKLSRLVVAAVLGVSSIGAAQPKQKPGKPPVKVAGTLEVTKLEPSKGDADGGTYVKIVGSGYLLDANGQAAPASAKVYFGSRQGVVVRFASDTELIVQAPGGKVGEVVDVLVVFQDRGQKKLAQAFTFVAPKP